MTNPKHITTLAGFASDDEFFAAFMAALKPTVTLWSYFVNWEKVAQSVAKYERELHLLNSLVGKSDFDRAANSLIREYPKVVAAVPALLAVREKSLSVLTDTTRFVYENFDFSAGCLTEAQIPRIIKFMRETGLADLLSEGKIKNVYDYATGVEVGLDSNGRKNRGGKAMEEIVEGYVKSACDSVGAEYLKEANGALLMREWKVAIPTSRRIDFVIRKDRGLFFIETNFYGHSGSKLKATAGEYTQMAREWKKKGVHFIWITDGNGWKTAAKPLREFFERADYLLNLELLSQGILVKVLRSRTGD